MGKYFSVPELCKSDTAQRLGIPNVPNGEQFENLEALIENVLDPCREAYMRPIKSSSGFRCARLNSAVGGETNSQHQKGEAVDLVSVKEGRQGNYLIGKLIIRNGVWDQLIFEDVGKNDMLPGWIHVSYKKNGNNRNQILKKVHGVKGYQAVSPKEIGL